MRRRNVIQYLLVSGTLLLSLHCLAHINDFVDPNDYPVLRKQFLDSFAKAEIGQDVSKLSLPQGWPLRALIQVIREQTGKWDVPAEQGMTVFRIYPYWRLIQEDSRITNASSPDLSLLNTSCVVLKVDKPSLTAKQLVEDFEGRESSNSVKLIEYAVYYSDGKSVHVSKK